MADLRTRRFPILMFAWILEKLAGFKALAIEAGAVLLAILTAIAYGRYKGEKAGINQVAAKSAEATQKAVDTRGKVDNAVQREAPGDAAKQLNKDWSRP
jgi:hypothetical protein